MGRMKRQLDFRGVGIAASLWLLSTAAAMAQAPSGAAPPSPVPGYRFEKRVLTSAALGEQRPYFVGLPDSYSGGAGRRYPVIYVLDGLSQGLPLATAAAELSRDKVMPELIVVAVPNVSGGRERDYTPPSMRQDHERPDSPLGKADAFLSFLRTELIPTIERDFRTAPERLLAGNSRGGLFVIYSLIAEPSLFHLRFAHSTPLWREDEHLVKRFDAFLSRTPDLRGALFLSVGGNETENMKRGFTSASGALRKRAPRALRWWAETTPNAVHADNAHMAAPVGFRRVYEGWTATR
jgi:predicted alpha/beta superfamily hydrolase